MKSKVAVNKLIRFKMAGLLSAEAAYTLFKNALDCKWLITEKNFCPVAFLITSDLPASVTFSLDRNRAWALESYKSN